MIEKIWLVIQESNVNGEILLNVVPCISKETAKEVMDNEIHTLMNEGHYTDYKEWPNDFVVEQTEESYYIKDNCDDYYEDIRIEEKEIHF